MELLKERAEKSIEVSWKEGIPAAVMLGIVDNYFIPYALFLGASTHQIGWIVAIPHLMGSLIQIYAVDLVRRCGSRRRFLIIGALVQALILFPFAAMAYTSGSWRQAAVLVLLALYRIVGNLVGTAWGSLISDYFPPHRRGDYFGWRAQITGIAGLLGIAAAGYFLFQMRKINAPLGFLILFSVAAVSRLISWWMMPGLMDLPLSENRTHDFTFYKFLKQFRKSNFVKFVIYVSAMTFSAHFSAPYFSVYMLKDLHFNYLIYASVQFAAVIAGLWAFPLWGTHADFAGNAKMLKLAGFFIPFLPLLWIYSSSPWILILNEAFSGFIWAGFNLCAVNYIYDAVTPEKRVRCIGYFNLCLGLAVFLGTSSGGYFAEKLPPINGHSLLTLFLFSSILRALAHISLFRKFKEVRDPSGRNASSMQLFFSLLGIGRLTDTVNERIFTLKRWRRQFDAEWLIKQSRKVQD